jgi:hypothetical protein
VAKERFLSNAGLTDSSTTTSNETVSISESGSPLTGSYTSRDSDRSSVGVEDYLTNAGLTEVSGIASTDVANVNENANNPPHAGGRVKGVVCELNGVGCQES